MEDILYQISDCYSSLWGLVMFDVTLLGFLFFVLKKRATGNISKKYTWILCFFIFIFIFSSINKYSNNNRLCHSRLQKLENNRVLISRGILSVIGNKSSDAMYIDKRPFKRPGTSATAGIGCWNDYFKENSIYIGKEVEIYYLRDRKMEPDIPCIVKVAVKNNEMLK